MFDIRPTSFDLAKKILSYPIPFTIQPKYLQPLVELDHLFESSLCTCLCFEYRFIANQPIDLILNLRADQGDMAKAASVTNHPEWFHHGSFSPFDIIKEIEKTPAWNRVIQHVWLEFDWSTVGSTSCPGLFLHFDGCRDGVYRNDSRVDLNSLMALLTTQSPKTISNWRSQIDRLLEYGLSDTGIFAIGWLPSRPKQTLRLCLSTLTFNSAKNLLTCLGIECSIVDEFSLDSDDLFFALSIDLSDSFENQFGLEVYPKDKSKILDLAKDFCKLTKNAGFLEYIAGWNGEGWGPDCYISREINHFKFSINKNKLKEIKAYLFGRYQSPSVRLRNSVLQSSEL